MCNCRKDEISVNIDNENLYLEEFINPITKDNLKTIIDGSYCCISDEAVKVSDLFSNGNKCSNKQFINMKIIVDKLNTLSDYYDSIEDEEELIDSNGLTVD